MAEEVLYEKELEIEKPTRNFDKATFYQSNPGGKPFDEKHYLPPGTLPDNGYRLVCRYIKIKD